MSYILDALRKADRERQRGTVPTLQGEPVLAAAPTQNTFLVYVLIALVLLAVGVGIGWWQPWRDAAPPAAAPLATIAAPTAPAVLATAPVKAPVQAAPPPAPPTPVAPPPVSVPPTVAATPAVSPLAPVILAPAPPPLTASAPAPVPAAEPAAAPAEVLALEDLPSAVRQELPNLTVQLHAYSSVPKERLVSVNDKLLREGDRISPALRLEQITKDGMIFSFKGYRFRRGVQ